MCSNKPQKIINMAKKPTIIYFLFSFSFCLLLLANQVLLHEPCSEISVPVNESVYSESPWTC